VIFSPIRRYRVKNPIVLRDVVAEDHEEIYRGFLRGLIEGPFGIKGVNTCTPVG
jgi:hypothetical protein